MPSIRFERRYGKPMKLSAMYSQVKQLRGKESQTKESLRQVKHKMNLRIAVKIANTIQTDSEPMIQLKFDSAEMMEVLDHNAKWL
jgi:hypothetical protein